MEVFISAAINALAPVLAAVAVAGGAWLLRNVNALVKANPNAKQYATLASIVTTVVCAVEQEFWAEDGDVKKSIAYGQIADLLKRYGIKLDFDAVDAAIEAAVLKEFGTK